MGWGDAHKRSYSVAVCQEDGQTASWRIGSDNDSLMYQRAYQRIRIQALVYESGPAGFSWVWCCQQAGIPVMVAAPSASFDPYHRLPTDSLDYRKLAVLASKDKIRSITIPT